MWKEFLNRYGTSSQLPTEESFLDKLHLHPTIQEELKKQIKSLDGLKSHKDLDENTIKSIAFINTVVENGLKNLDPRKDVISPTGSIIREKLVPTIGSSRDPIGYDAAGSVLKRLYPNPFKLHAFIAENFWAARKARNELFVEVDRDDYVVVASEKTAKKRVKEVSRALEELNIRYLRNKLRDNIVVFGNTLVETKRNKLKGILSLNPLLMERVTALFDQDTDELKGWQYEYGNKHVIYNVGELDHIKTFNASSNVLGSPAWKPVVILIEAALHAAIYNNTLMQKGGLMSTLIALDKLEGSQAINDSTYLEIADKLTNFINKRFGGLKGSGQTAFMPLVKDVHMLHKIGEMDNAFSNLMEMAAIQCGTLVGVSPERLGLSRSSQYQNNTLIDDSVAMSLDNHIYYTQRLVDDYITQKIINETLGYDDIHIEASGEFSSVTKTGAEVGKLLSECNAKIITVNEFRVKILHIGPIDGPEGEMYLGELLEKKGESAIAKALAPTVSSEPKCSAFTDLKLIRYPAKYCKYLD